MTWLLENLWRLWTVGGVIMLAFVFIGSFVKRD